MNQRPTPLPRLCAARHRIVAAARAASGVIARDPCLSRRRRQGGGLPVSGDPIIGRRTSDGAKLTRSRPKHEASAPARSGSTRPHHRSASHRGRQSDLLAERSQVNPLNQHLRDALCDNAARHAWGASRTRGA